MTTPSEDADVPLRALLFCPHFSEEQWQLPIDEAFGDRALIGWTTQRPSVDGGIPSSVAHLFANAFCRHSTVTFAKAIRPPAGAGILSRQWRIRGNFVWSSTRDPDEAAAGMFDEELFAWPRQGQIVLLSDIGDVPALDEQPLALPSNPTVVRSLRDLGVRAAFLPGVDGDIAGLYAFDPTAADTLRGELVEAARGQGANVDVLDEQAFARSLAG